VGAFAVLAGLLGLFLHYRKERRQQTEEESGPEPRIHRQTSCRIEATLVDRLVRALRLLQQRAVEKNWEPDWSEFEEHLGTAEKAVAGSDLAVAFAEYCRAMLPLTRAFNKQRQKEESFQPVWDRTP
jgi:hypothetical protein